MAMRFSIGEPFGIAQAAVIRTEVTALKRNNQRVSATSPLGKDHIVLSGIVEIGGDTFSTIICEPHSSTMTSSSAHLLLDDLSLGSYREFYKFLPPQLVTTSSSCGWTSTTMRTSETSIQTDLSSNCCDSTTVTEMNEEKFSVTAETAPTTPDTTISMSIDTSAFLPHKIECNDTPDATVQDRIQVAVRIRPLQKQELQSSPRRVRQASQQQALDPRAWKIYSSETGPTLQPSSGRGQAYSVDCVFNEDTCTEEVYKTSGKPVVRAVATGCHGTIFAYGPTGSGKTFTMQGEGSCKGIVELAAEDLLEAAESSRSASLLRVQYFEIYNEVLRDLLAPDSNSSESNVRHNAANRTVRRQSEQPTLLLREDEKGNSIVSAHEEIVSSVEDVLRLVRRGNRHRTVSATAMNARSSRSHAIFRLTLESRDEDCVRVSVLNLVDLAGSENSALAAVTGLRKREGGKINQSLLSLSRVIHSLSLPEHKRPKFINYRDSKLTRILQPHLSGNACLSLLCCISTSRRCIEETRSTLKFAASAKRVAVQPVVNEIVDPKQMLLSLRKELAETKECLQRLQERVEGRDLPTDDVSALKPFLDSVDEVVPLFLDSSPSSVQDTDASSEAVIGEGVDDPDELFRTLMERTRATDASGPPVAEVVVLNKAPILNNDVYAQLTDAQQRAQFLEEKLEATDDLVETLFRELKIVQRCNRELNALNLELQERLAKYEEQDIASAEDMDVLMKQCTLLKYAIYCGLGFFVCGQTELFLATVMLLWLTLEIV